MPCINLSLFPFLASYQYFELCPSIFGSTFAPSIQFPYIYTPTIALTDALTFALNHTLSNPMPLVTFASTTLPDLATLDAHFHTLTNSTHNLQQRQERWKEITFSILTTKLSVFDTLFHASPSPWESPASRRLRNRHIDIYESWVENIERVASEMRMELCAANALIDDIEEVFGDLKWNDDQHIATYRCLRIEVKLMTIALAPLYSSSLFNKTHTRISEARASALRWWEFDPTFRLISARKNGVLRVGKSYCGFWKGLRSLLA